MKKTQYVIAIRHDEHKNDFLLDSSVERCMLLGKRLPRELKKMGIDLPAVALSSPRLRAVATLYYVLQGMKHTLPIHSVVPAFGDVRTGKYPFSEKEIKKLYALDKKSGTADADRYTVAAYPDKMTLRGKEGAQALRKLLQTVEGPFILVSHGGSRLEAMVQVMKGKSVLDSDYFFERSGVAIWSFAVDEKKVIVKKEEYLGILK